VDGGIIPSPRLLLIRLSVFIPTTVMAFSVVEKIMVPNIPHIEAISESYVPTSLVSSSFVRPVIDIQ
jgi:hypothetical protein